MGRPARIVDEELARKLERLLVAAGSKRQLAFALDLEPTTLARSLAERAFTPSTKAQIMARIDDAESALEEANNSRKRRMLNQNNKADVLQILQKLYTLLPDAIAALEAASGRVASR